jgi:hypothetical protein
MIGNAAIAIVSNATLVDANGDVVEESSSSSSSESSSSGVTPWPGAFFAPRYANDDVTNHGARVVVGLTVYGPPPPVALDSADQLVIDGVTYDIQGHPGDWKSPFTGWHPGVEVAVKRAAAS